MDSTFGRLVRAIPENGQKSTAEIKSQSVKKVSYVVLRDLTVWKYITTSRGETLSAAVVGQYQYFASKELLTFVNIEDGLPVNVYKPIHASHRSHTPPASGAIKSSRNQVEKQWEILEYRLKQLIPIPDPVPNQVVSNSFPILCQTSGDKSEFKNPEPSRKRVRKPLEEIMVQKTRKESAIHRKF